MTRAANAGTGENDGFLVLSGNGVERRVPYAFLVERPALANALATPLRSSRSATPPSARTASRPTAARPAPFGPPPDYRGAPMNEDGAEHLY